MSDITLTCMACGDTKKFDAEPLGGTLAVSKWWNNDRGRICKKCLDALDATIVETT